VPYRGSATNVVSNGLLLRADLHVLFDCGLIAIDPDKMLVVISSSLRNTGYRQLDGKALRLPKTPAHRPNRKALEQHRSLLRP
jgi:predicted restriction endonuclease